MLNTLTLGTRLERLGISTLGEVAMRLNLAWMLPFTSPRQFSLPVFLFLKKQRVTNSQT